MSMRELRVQTGLTQLRANDAHDPAGYVVLTIEQVGVGNSMTAMLDRAAQHWLMLYLQERLAR